MRARKTVSLQKTINYQKVNVIKSNTRMKKFLLAVIMLFSVSAMCTADNDPEVERLKAQQEVLKLNGQLTKLKIAYEKATSETSELKRKAMEANSHVNTAATPKLSTADAAATAKEAKARAKALKKVKNANNKLAKNQKNIATLEKKMQKVQSLLDKLGKKIEFVNQ